MLFLYIKIVCYFIIVIKILNNNKQINQIDFLNILFATFISTQKFHQTLTSINKVSNNNNPRQMIQGQGRSISHSSRIKILKRLIQTKSFLTAISIILAQIVIIVIHSLYIRPVVQNNKDLFIRPLSIFTSFLLALASTLGLGLLFSYSKKLIISGLGFSLFITGYVLQFYPLISALWTSSKLFKSNYQDQYLQKPFFLSQYVINDKSLSVNTNFNSIQGCFRAAMAVNVAVSCVLGRVQLFQIFITILLGTFGYELNRRICMENFGNDALGSMYIFGFGGFMGLAMGLVLRFKDRVKKYTQNNINYTANQFSIALSLLGSAILMICLPFFTLLHHKNFTTNIFSLYTPALSVIFSTSQGLVGSVIISLIFKGQITIRDFIHGPVAGAIIGGASSYFTANIAYCLGVGLLGGMIQTLVQIYLQRKFSNQYRPVSTVSFTLFGIQGFLASITACIGKAIIESNAQNLPYNQLGYKTINLLIFGIISSALGFGFGLIIGFICYLVSVDSKTKNFNDFHNWIIIFDEQPERQPQKTSESGITNPPGTNSSVSTLRPPDIIDVPF